MGGKGPPQRSKNMKMYKYPLSGIWSQSTDFGLLTPIYYQEVIAGQSLNLKLKLRVVTDSLKKAAMNRVWFDVMVFYIPFRVLWSGWPDFISTDTGTIPTVNNKWDWNYERDHVAGGGVHAAWQRTTYNRIYNDVFRSGKQAVVTETDLTPLTVLNRSRSFQNTLLDEAVEALPVSTVDTSGATLDIDDIRRAHVEQRTDRLAYFFDDPTNQEYLQLLERLGVKAGWEIDDMPRLIGQFHARATFETVMDTGGPSIGSPSGFFSGHIEVNARQRFIPEHGIIGAYLIPRMEFPLDRMGSIPLAAKVEKRFYYIDGQKQEPPVQWSRRFVGDGSDTENMNAPAWQDYRSSVSQMYASRSAGSPPDDNYAIVGAEATADKSPDGIRNFDSWINGGDFFRSFIGNSEVVTYLEVSGSQRSPVPPQHAHV